MRISALQRWLPLPPRAEDEIIKLRRNRQSSTQDAKPGSISTRIGTRSITNVAQIFLTQTGFDMSQANGSWRREVDDSTPPPTRRIRKAASTPGYAAWALLSVTPLNRLEHNDTTRTATTTCSSAVIDMASPLRDTWTSLQVPVSLIVCTEQTLPKSDSRSFDLQASCRTLTRALVLTKSTNHLAGLSSWTVPPLLSTIMSKRNDLARLECYYDVLCAWPLENARLVQAMAQGTSSYLSVSKHHS
ncbi:hypothetical protein M431DRAFT_533010 [Trichoderma harzianum CBS 226.95]|uniref:Uncharacterized protein n=1 Tax=Trichoderma harzianum CBS 226.95 TaxID=983964 RepID=A0A2T4A3B0_TRIHA|nr:hypothetical protein M431DRAFT_533010 [Trichoderma harzianum CBS 226.95]PTB51539.1 hypothetical protein M431DRAFT_533010 [Trichoderma harzianum CBS 226.95]